jgi:uncharacterized protein YbgA (DUF1722 family)
VSLSDEERNYFILDRFHEVKESKNFKNLVEFHTINKYLLMAHSTENLNLLGNFVANQSGLHLEDVMNGYEKTLKETLNFLPSTKSHCNTIYHIFGHFSKNLTSIKKLQFLGMVEQFKQNRTTLDSILHLLKNMTIQYDKTYLIRQTYFLLFTNSIIKKVNSD